MVLAFVLGGCQLTRDFSDVKLSSPVCSPGDVTECSCPNGQWGHQQCTEDATFEACVCDQEDASVSPDSPSDTEPPAAYEVIVARGQTIELTDGEVFENKLIDFTGGGDIRIDTTDATNWRIRNVGFKGRKQTPGDVFHLADADDGTSIIENIYLGDGSGRNGGQPTCGGTSGCNHGPTAIYVVEDHSGHITFRHINVQGWPGNGIYASAPGAADSGKLGTIHIDQSYAANNYVSGLRIGGGSGNRITDSTSFNDDRDYDGRPIWVWKPGPIAVRGVHLDQGSYPHAMVAGANGSATVINLHDSQVRGVIHREHGSTIETVNVGASPDLTPPDGVPLSAEEAAGGWAGH